MSIEDVFADLVGGGDEEEVQEKEVEAVECDSCGGSGKLTGLGAMGVGEMSCPKCGPPVRPLRLPEMEPQYRSIAGNPVTRDEALRERLFVLRKRVRRGLDRYSAKMLQQMVDILG